MNLYYLLNYVSILIAFLPLLLAIYLKIKRALFVNKWKSVLFQIFLILLSLLLIYSRFLEPNTVIQKETNIETGFKSKIVLISDLHVGAFSSTKMLVKVIEEINSIDNVDFVVIAGDIVYHPKGDLRTLLSPLKNLKYPVYLVLGNHDSERNRNNYEEEIKAIVSDFNFYFLKNNSEYIEELNLYIVGLGDLWAGDADISKISQFSKDDNLVVIAHSPDTVYKYDKSIPQLTLSGHTHGGQIRIPLIYKWFIPSKYGFNQGLYNTPRGKVYVSSGIGNTGLPFRLGIPPCIDVIYTQ